MLGAAIGGLGALAAGAIAFPDRAEAARPTLDGLDQRLTNLEADVTDLEADMAAIPNQYVPKSGGTITGNVSVEGNLSALGAVQVGTTTAISDSSNYGALRFNTATQKIEVSTAAGWIALQNAAPAAPPVATFRWNTWSTYDQANGWFADNRSELFGGVNPSNWSDNNGTAAQMATDLDTLGTLFNKVAKARRNALVAAEYWWNYSSTNGRFAAALFRVRNITGSSINWTLHFYFTGYADWGERASVAVNGSPLFLSSGNHYTNSSAAVGVTMPAGTTSTVIVVSASSPPFTVAGGAQGPRCCLLAFYNNCLLLPAGLEFVDDLNG